jgi:hypothetical protein
LFRFGRWLGSPRLLGCFRTNRALGCFRRVRCDYGRLDRRCFGRRWFHSGRCRGDFGLGHHAWWEFRINRRLGSSRAHGSLRPGCRVG